jgi:hypothetical protein
VAAATILELLRLHPSPLELGEELERSEFMDAYNMLKSYQQNDVMVALLKRVEYVLCEIETAYDSPELARHASLTFTWMADHVYDYSGASADEPSAWFMKALDADPHSERALRGYVNAVLEHMYTSEPDALEKLASSLDDAHKPRALRLRLVHLALLQLLHNEHVELFEVGDSQTRIYQAAHRAYDAGASSKDWSDMLAWMARRDVHDTWFTAWLKA